MIAAAILAGALAGAPAIASCYDLPETQQLRSVAPQTADTNATFLVDESVVFPAPVRLQMLEAVDAMARPGSTISIGSFSSYSGAHYPQITLSIRFDTPLPKAKEGSVSRQARDILARCIEWRRRDGVARLRAMLSAQFTAARTSIGQSDIMSSLKQFGQRVRDQRYRRNVLIVASDLIENSTTTSFYRAGLLRAVDPDRELATASKRDLLADLGGTQVYLVGVAFQPTNATVPVDTVQRLERFWVGWFKRSGAASVRVGKPLLLDPIQ